MVDPPEIISLVAADPAGTDSIYGNGDTITIRWNIDTDRAGLAVGVVQPRTVVDTLFSFTQVVQALLVLQSHVILLCIPRQRV